jgi:hypothetical protein
MARIFLLRLIAIPGVRGHRVGLNEPNQIHGIKHDPPADLGEGNFSFVHPGIKGALSNAKKLASFWNAQ